MDNHAEPPSAALQEIAASATRLRELQEAWRRILRRMPNRPLSLDLAEQIVALFTDSGATHVQRETAIDIVRALVEETRPRSLTALRTIDESPSADRIRAAEVFRQTLHDARDLR